MSEKPTTGFSPQQVAEEKLKAELILGHTGWRSLIERAESHGYFRGQIDFLLDFCGSVSMGAKKDMADRDGTQHLSVQNIFDDCLKKAEAMFGPQGLKDIGDHLWQRALLSIGDYLLPSGRQNISFLVNSSTEQASWKRLLRGTGPKVPEARRFLRGLFDRLNSSESMKDQLDAIIATATGLEEWRAVIVRTPKAISYCEKRVIRWTSTKQVYLLRTTTMKGYHAELFTFCLYHNSIVLMARDGRLGVFNVLDYSSAAGTDVEPGIRLTFTHLNLSVHFEIEFLGGEYLVYVSSQSLSNWPEIGRVLKEVAGFTEQSGLLSTRHSPANIEDVLQSLAQSLAISFPNGTPHA